MNSLLAKTASLTSAIADRDAVIGRTIDNLNTVLGTVDAHDQQLLSLIDQLQRFTSGLAADRETIGSSLSGINTLSAETADLLVSTRPLIKDDVAQLRTPGHDPQQAGQRQGVRGLHLGRHDAHHDADQDGLVRLVVQLLPVPVRHQEPAPARCARPPTTSRPRGATHEHRPSASATRCPSAPSACRHRAAPLPRVQRLEPALHRGRHVLQRGLQRGRRHHVRTTTCASPASRSAR